MTDRWVRWATMWHQEWMHGPIRKTWCGRRIPPVQVDVREDRPDNVFACGLCRGAANG